MNNYKILIVDDDVEVLKVIIRFLEIEIPKCKIYQATNGELAKRIIDSIAIDIVLTDWDMPAMSGIELTRNIVSRENNNYASVIIMTGVMMDTNDLKTALEAGAFDYIRKPIDKIELCARINSALKFSKLHQLDIERKNNELVENTMLLVKYHEFNLKIQKQLRALLDNETNDTSRQIIKNLINELDEKIRAECWEKFEIAFNAVHSDFSKNLLANYPQLTPSELNLSMFIKLGMNLKDTSSLLYISPESLKVARSRLRKKFDLDAEASLQNFLAVY